MRGVMCRCNFSQSSIDCQNVTAANGAREKCFRCLYFEAIVRARVIDNHSLCNSVTIGLQKHDKTYSERN